MESSNAGPRPHMSASGPVRRGADPITTGLQLGPLAPLSGSWQGTGFNQIWRPDNNQPPENSQIRRFLELNLTNETFSVRRDPGGGAEPWGDIPSPTSICSASITSNRSATPTRRRSRPPARLSISSRASS